MHSQSMKFYCLGAQPFYKSEPHHYVLQEDSLNRCQVVPVSLFWGGNADIWKRGSAWAAPRWEQVFRKIRKQKRFGSRIWTPPQLKQRRLQLSLCSLTLESWKVETGIRVSNKIWVIFFFFWCQHHLYLHINSLKSLFLSLFKEFYMLPSKNCWIYCYFWTWKAKIQ